MTLSSSAMGWFVHFTSACGSWKLYVLYQCIIPIRSGHFVSLIWCVMLFFPGGGEGRAKGELGHTSDDLHPHRQVSEGRGE